MDEMNTMQTNDQYTAPAQDSAMPRDEQTTAAPSNMKIDDKAVKKIVGEAMSKVDGVLGVSGGLTDLLKSNDDVTKGISVTMQNDENKCTVDLKLIAEYGKSVPEIVNNVTDEVTSALKQMAGLTVDKINVEVTDVMTREEYKQKYESKNSNSN